MNKRKYILTYVLVILTGFTAVLIWLQALLSLKLTYEGSIIITNFILSKTDPYGIINAEIFADIIYVTVHSLEYIILGMELTLLRKLIKEPRILTNGLIALSVAVIDESIQWIFDPSNSVLHIGVDFTGALIGLAIIQLIFFIKKRIDKILSDSPADTIVS